MAKVIARIRYTAGRTAPTVLSKTPARSIDLRWKLEAIARSTPTSATEAPQELMEGCTNIDVPGRRNDHGD